MCFVFVPILGLSLKSPCFWPLFWSYNPCFIPNFSIVATWVKLGTIWLKLGTVRKIRRIFTLTRRGLMGIWAAVKVRKPGLIPSFFPVYCFHPEILFPGPSTPSLGYIKGNSNMYLHWISVHSTWMGGPLLSSLFLGTFQDNLLSCEEDLQNGAKNIIIQNGQGHHLWGKWKC